jgi:hypothetical protein
MIEGHGGMLNWLDFRELRRSRVLHIVRFFYT